MIGMKIDFLTRHGNTAQQSGELMISGRIAKF